MSYYIDPTVSPSGIGAINDPANALPSTIVASTEYDVKAGTTLTLAANENISTINSVIVNSYGAGNNPIITGNPSDVRFTLSGTTSNFLGENFTLDGSASTNSLVSITASGGGNAFNNVTFLGNPTAGANVNAINVGGNTALTNFSVINSVFSGSYRALAYLLNTASITTNGITFTGNTVTGTLSDPFRVSIETAADGTSSINNITVSDNVFDTCAGNVWIRNTLTILAPPLRGDGVLVSNNILRDFANAPVAANQPATLTVSGYTNAVIRGNTITNCFTSGGLIQTTGNSGLIIEYNYLAHAVTHNASLVDSVGIFDDQGNDGSTVRYNTIVDCPGYGNPTPPDNYGGGIAFWHSTNARHYCNVIKDSNKGWTYGYTGDTGNKVYNNTLINNATAALYRYGTGALAGNLLFKNNLIIGSAAVEGGGTSSANLVTNLSYATTALAGLVVDAVGLPIGLAPGSPCIGVGTDLDQYTVSKSGFPFYSPPSVGAHEVPRPFDMFSVGWMG